MITLVVDYQPFSNSNIFAVIDGREEVYSINSSSVLANLAGNILHQAGLLRNLYLEHADEIKVRVRAAEDFYNELSKIVQTHKHYSNLPITMERIEE